MSIQSYGGKTFGVVWLNPPLLVKEGLRLTFSRYDR